MNRVALRLALLGIGALPLAVGGCRGEVVVRDRPAVHREVIYAEPPPDREEVIVRAPSPDHVWIRGHYVRRGDHWDWEGGRWEARPRREAVWVPGHWDREGRGYFWVEGHWR